MNTFIASLALTATCFTGLYLLPSNGTAATTTTAQYTSSPCSSHNSVNPGVHRNRIHAEQCHPWISAQSID